MRGEGESHSEDDMDSYGWGTKVEEWVSDRNGENWKLVRDLSPKPGYKYQNIQFVSRDLARESQRPVSALRLAERVRVRYGLPVGPSEP